MALVEPGFVRQLFSPRQLPFAATPPSPPLSPAAILGRVSRLWVSVWETELEME